MAKFTNIKKLSKREQEELFIKFARVISSVRNPLEAANLIKDLFSESESLMLARRLQIAQLLDRGFTYDQIRKLMRVSRNTIARVNIWLELYGEGYRIVLQRNKDDEAPLETDGFSLRQIKRQYPMYAWPQILLENVVKSASRRGKARLLGVLRELKEKTKLSKNLEKLLKQEFMQKAQ